MNFLLDTHAFIWAVTEPDKLSKTAAAVIEDGETELYISAVSFWEIAIKIRLGRLESLGKDAKSLIEVAELTGITPIPLDPDEAESSHKLSENTHFDPFNRMLAWQAIQRKLTLISADATLKRFKKDGLKLLW